MKLVSMEDYAETNKMHQDKIKASKSIGVRELREEYHKLAKTVLNIRMLCIRDPKLEDALYDERVEINEKILKMRLEAYEEYGIDLGKAF